MPFTFEMVSPQTTLLSEQVERLTIMTEMGEITVLPGHIPLVATLKPGEARVQTQEGEKSFAVFGGFLQVQPNNRVIVLADEAERVEDLVLEEIEEAKERAKQALEQAKEAGEFDEAALALEREMARLRVARKYKAKGIYNPQAPTPPDA